MEKPFKNEEEITKKWVEEAGLARPKASFSNDVLQRIQSKPTIVRAKPLVPSTGWIGIAAFFVFGMALLYFYPIERGIFSIPFDTTTLKFPKGLGDFKISNTALYAFAFLSLFLLQIPFLKKFMEKQGQ